MAEKKTKADEPSADTRSETPAKKDRRTWWLLGASVAVSLLVLLAYFHMSKVKYWFDPAQTSYEFMTVHTATSPTAEAKAHLSIAENRLKVLKKMQAAK